MPGPGRFNVFKGLWNRGHTDECPPDHLSECENVEFISARITTRNGYRQFFVEPNIVRMHLYKPNPPFAGTNVPRIISLNSNGQLKDVLLNVVLHTDVLWKDFALVNFFGRCYISPHDGKVGIQNQVVWTYNGTGVLGFLQAAAPIPTVALTAAISGVNGSVKFEIGDYVISYAYETSTGFITQPWAPFVKVSSFGGWRIEITNLPLGPAGTAARWIIMSKVIQFETAGGIGNPQLPGNAAFYPLFLAKRVGDNTTTVSFVDQYDNDLINTADDLFSSRTTIPAGVGMLDYKGRMVVYGIYENPSIVLVSQIGDPENFSATSGFLITEPSDNTGIRSCVEFRDILYIFKRQRGGMTQDNGNDASTWQLVEIEKAYGTEQYGIAAVLDAKGSSSEGFIMASLGGLVYFNGVFVEPTLSFKIRDLWHRITENYFHLVQVALDPTHRRIYILVPLDESPTLTHIIFGDYRDGLDPMNIKWSIWKLAKAARSILIYTDLTNNIPEQVTRVANINKIVTLDMNDKSLTHIGDDYTPISAFFVLPPVRFSEGLSEFNNVRLRAGGPGTINLVAYGEDKATYFVLQPVVIGTSTPGREYSQLMNLVSEQCQLRVSCNEQFIINDIIIEGGAKWTNRPR